MNLDKNVHVEAGVSSRGKSKCKKFPHLGMVSNLCTEGTKGHIRVVAEKTMESILEPRRLCVLAMSPSQLDRLEEEVWMGVGTPEQNLGRSSRD